MKRFNMKQAEEIIYKHLNLFKREKGFVVNNYVNNPNNNKIVNEDPLNIEILNNEIKKELYETFGEKKSVVDLVNGLFTYIYTNMAIATYMVGENIVPVKIALTGNDAIIKSEIRKDKIEKILK